MSASTFLSPTTVLRLGGIVLLALGVIGLTGVTNNIAFFNLDSGENIAHIGLGIIGLVAGFGVKDPAVHRGLTAVIAVTGLFTGLYGFALPAGDEMHRNFFGLANLENPADNLLHVVVGLWAAAAAVANRPAMAMAESRA
jgi:hypothetical protein